MCLERAPGGCGEKQGGDSAVTRHLGGDACPAEGDMDEPVTSERALNALDLLALGGAPSVDTADREGDGLGAVGGVEVLL